MFVDEIVVELKAGDGGDGCTAFRREKYIAMGGPFGGSGGSGGNIIFKVDEGLKTLVDLRYKRIIKGSKGSNGLGKAMNGRGAESTFVKVPLGTTIIDEDSNLVIADLTKRDSEVIVAYGGRGGRGNIALSSRSNPCPDVSENGEPGEIRKIKVELKLLGDVGLVGLPSVGKSTLLKAISNANPKIGAYHFTTLAPNLGVVKQPNQKEFVVADLPGLIKGASNGEGLGIKFLKHIERTKIIAHIIDMSAFEGRDPYEDFELINNELRAFSPTLLEKPQLIIANKMDVIESKDNLEIFRKKLNNEDIKIFEISAINKDGVYDMLDYLANMVQSLDEVVLYKEENLESHILYKFRVEKPFTIIYENNIWLVKGNDVEKLLRMTKFNTSESINRFANKLRRMGIDEELEKLGAKEGDIVRILDYEFEYER